jgi:hypothetical protein
MRVLVTGTEELVTTIVAPHRIISSSGLEERR